MRVAINARLLADASLRGWNRYTVNLLAELSRLDVSLILLSDKPIHPSHLARFRPGSYIEVVSPPMRYWKWEQRWLPAECARQRADVLHGPFNFGLPWSSPCPKVLTLHDAIADAYTAPRTPLRQRWNLAAIKNRLHHWIARTRADRVITVSNHAKADIVRLYRLPAEKVSVIYPAVEERFFVPVDDAKRERVREKYRLPPRYVFYVGGFEGRKNVEFLVRAFAEADLAGVDLVLGGGSDGDRARLAALAESLLITSRVHFTGWIDDDDLPALYSSAVCFVYPSEYEGFGLQLLEAMAAGCPVIAANATSLPEVLGGIDNTVELGDTASLALALTRVTLTDRPNATAMQSRAREFNWRRTAEQTLGVYADVAGIRGLSQASVP